MARRLRLAFLALLAIAGATPAAAQVRAVDLYAPRAFGYVIGDALTLTADITLDAPFTLDPAALPTPRALNYWLDLREVRLDDHGVEGGQHRYTLGLTYQTFYAPLEPRRLDIPAIALSATDGARRVAVNVPGWSFLSSPLREVMTSTPGQAMTLRPDTAPRMIPTAGTRHALLASLVIALGALAVLAWQMGWWPFHRRRARPFAMAARAMAGALGSPSSESAYRGSLMALHRAFDTTAGHGLFAEDLPGFFAAHPAFRAVEGEVRRLFAVSRDVFFGGDAPGAQRALPPGELLALARRLRAVEREAS
ncbi:nonribosomal peptide synthetase MxaA [Ancylobacter sp. A5.8]|uniref:nonribosomal peptide synthetase MxaA n=1 Tax=Ancylobacter gelatini TaxID=2919920 RepID=UPI001F4DEF54|nr:nonribosomal peptide synthetase MxaA [Ancylobacter gelatini]MCJ8144052.1 nonribosomal peptide synthetase MxaA [Ancylobacter gelatini]